MLNLHWFLVKRPRIDGFQKFLDPEDVARPSGHSDIGFVKIIRPVVFGVNIQFMSKVLSKKWSFSM